MIALDVKNMSCQHCVKSVTGAIQSLDAGAAVQVDLQTGKVLVDSAAAAADLARVVTDAGYPAAVAKGPVPAAATGGCGGCGSCGCGGR